MKKFIILTILILTSIASNATTINQARQNLGYELNQTVNVLKDYFATVKNQLEEDSTSISNINSDVDALATKSKEYECNYTILPHGKAQIKICEEKEELRWKNSQWKCEKPKYFSDCKPTKGEIKVATKSGGYTCKQNGKITENNLGFGVCNNTTGERQTQIECLFTNSSTNQAYQITNKNCSPSKIQRYKQPCGPNGDKSSCKCPAGSTYRYKNGKSQCIYTFDYIADTEKSYSEEKTVNLNYQASGQQCLHYSFNVHCSSSTGCGRHRHYGCIKYYSASVPAKYITYALQNKWEPVNRQGPFTYTKISYPYKMENTKSNYAPSKVKYKEIINIMKWTNPAGKDHTQATCIEGPATKNVNEANVYSNCWKKELITNIPTCTI